MKWLVVMLALLISGAVVAEDEVTEKLLVVEFADQTKYWVRKDNGAAQSPTYPIALAVDSKMACVNVAYSIESDGLVGLVKPLKVHAIGRALTRKSHKALMDSVNAYFAGLAHVPGPHNAGRAAIFTRDAVIVFVLGEGFDVEEIDPRKLASHCAIESLEAELAQPSLKSATLTEDPIEVVASRVRRDSR